MLTGASSGLGVTTARMALRRDARMVLAARSARQREAGCRLVERLLRQRVE